MEPENPYHDIVLKEVSKYISEGEKLNDISRIGVYRHFH